MPRPSLLFLFAPELHAEFLVEPGGLSAMPVGLAARGNGLCLSFGEVDLKEAIPFGKVVTPEVVNFSWQMLGSI